MFLFLDVVLERRADRDRQRRPQHRGRAEHGVLEVAAVQKRILAAREPGFLAHQLRHQPSRVDAAHQENPEVAMERRHQVALQQRGADAGDDRLLAGARVDSAENFVLPVKPRDAIFKAADQLHPVIKLQFVFDAGCAAWGGHDRAFDLSHHAPRRSASNPISIAGLRGPQKRSLKDRRHNLSPLRQSDPSRLSRRRRAGIISEASGAA